MFFDVVALRAICACDRGTGKGKEEIYVYIYICIHKIYRRNNMKQTFLDISIAVIGRPGITSNMSNRADPGTPSLYHWTTLYTRPSSVEYHYVYYWKKIKCTRPNVTCTCNGKTRVYVCREKETIHYECSNATILTGGGVIDGVVQMIAERDVIENVDHETREEQVTHVEYWFVVFVRHRFVHQRVTAYEIQHGI